MMITERRWLHQRSYWVKGQKYETLDGCVSSLGLVLSEHWLKSPWCQVSMHDLTINEAIKQMKEQHRFLARKIRQEPREPQPIYRDGCGDWCCFGSKHVDVSSLLSCAAIELIGHYMISGSKFIKLPDLDVATINEGWQRLYDQCVKSRKEREILADQIINYIK